MAAGVLLVVDGVGALLLSGVLLFMSALPPVAAIEGRPPQDQNLFGPGFAALVLAVACFWAGRRALARVRSARWAGIVLAASVAAALASVPLTGSAMDAVEVVFLVALTLAQALIIVGLIRWPGTSTAAA